MELAWVCEESGRQFQRVPQQLADEAGECCMLRHNPLLVLRRASMRRVLCGGRTVPVRFVFADMPQALWRAPAG